jgi:hypothetical protein
MQASADKKHIEEKPKDHHQSKDQLDAHAGDSTYQ